MHPPNTSPERAAFGKYGLLLSRKQTKASSHLQPNLGNMTGSTRDQREGFCVVLAHRGGKSGKEEGERRIATVTREEDTWPHHLGGAPARPCPQNDSPSSVFTPEDRLMKESHTEAEPVLGVPLP